MVTEYPQETLETRDVQIMISSGKKKGGAGEGQNASG